LVLRKLGERLYCKACLAPLKAAPPGISHLAEKATALATELHEGQTRKGTDIPYITHPVAVAALVTYYGGSDAQIAAALLHDTVEDCGERCYVEQRIFETCGKVVANLVLEVTKPVGSSKPEQVAHLACASKEAALVSACDKLHNMMSIINDGGPWERFKGGREQVTTYYSMVCPLLAWKIGRPSIESALRERLDKLLSLP
jgi:(p)ppGpp synthase/HD superfamily hydrolase